MKKIIAAVFVLIFAASVFAATPAATPVSGKVVKVCKGKSKNCKKFKGPHTKAATTVNTTNTTK